MPTMETPASKWRKVNDNLYSDGGNAFLQKMTSGNWHLFVNIHNISITGGRITSQDLADIPLMAKMEADAKLAVADLRMRDA